MENDLEPAVCKAPCQGRFEKTSGLSRVTADQHAVATGPQAKRAAKPLDELLGEIFPDDAPNAVCPEVLSQRFEYCGALRALCSPAFLRSTIRASRVRKPSRLRTTRRFGSASTSARAMP